MECGWGPVTACNMKCQFCYSKGARIDTRELSLTDWKKFIDENHEFIHSINYGTGENSMCDDWFKLIDYVSNEYGILQGVTTNGFLYEKIKTNLDLDKIVNKNIKEVDVSLDFSIPEKHNHFRGQPHAYEWAINTLRYCEKNGLTATIVFIGTNETLDKDNIDGLFEITKRYNAKIRMNIFRPTMRDKKVISRFICEYRKIIETLKYINERYKILSISDPLFSAILTDGYYEEDPSGKNSIRILGDGSITPSTYLISSDFICGNIKDSRAFHLLGEKLRNKMKVVVPEECRKCIFVDACQGGVVDRRFLWYNTSDTRDPYCPFRKDNYLPDFNVNIDEEKEFESIHHGYLPTFFFEN